MKMLSEQKSCSPGVEQDLSSRFEEAVGKARKQAFKCEISKRKSKLTPLDKSKMSPVLKKSYSVSSANVCAATKNGRWTKEEHFRFLEALKLFGKEWRRV